MRTEGLKEVTADEYFAAFKKYELKPIGSFSDPDGVISFGYGCPAMDTDWGVGELLIARCEMRKEDAHQAAWDFRYFLTDVSAEP